MLPACTTTFYCDQVHNEDNANNDGTQSNSESYRQAEYKHTVCQSYNTVQNNVPPATIFTLWAIKRSELISVCNFLKN